jgi:hypothetical protein
MTKATKTKTIEDLRTEAAKCATAIDQVISMADATAAVTLYREATVELMRAVDEFLAANPAPKMECEHLWQQGFDAAGPTRYCKRCGKWERD